MTRMPLRLPRGCKALPLLFLYQPTTGPAGCHVPGMWCEQANTVPALLERQSGGLCTQMWLTLQKELLWEVFSVGCGWEVREKTVGKVEKVRHVGRGAAGEPLTLAGSKGWKSKPGPGTDYPRVTGLRILGLWMLLLQISKVCHKCTCGTVCVCVCVFTCVCAQVIMCDVCICEFMSICVRRGHA